MHKWFVALLLLAASLTATAAEQAIVDRYKASCYACHGFGANGAPKTGVEADWSPRLEKGMDTLMKHTNEGFNAMPPKGLCFNCSADEFKALIEYMATPQS
ncbi:c-type cytochrome [Zhongshania sp.]|jgi:cytochrome c5|uniref:c-type cytochrome n=1 Tax=Zhongshania sp. TaxID=1971902 RepID=UPI001B72A9EC|nr:c-type cytochrome [Zhongshania sp.]MBQ0797468.1 cytochrome c5 family protein [Zhongshania sp.]|tara:strand:+ start:2221 stop:2523 length:303 start_codon:yes stop_codon:yes gene_type:complete